jgi:hypothetical protein
MKKLPIFIFLTMLTLTSHGQNETKQWYFGAKSGLDFNTSPPTVLINSAMNSFTGCASVADSTGSLLFYTKGDTIWNRLHQVMANGTGILGNPNFTQSSLILKQPGSNSMYYVFTRSGQNASANLNYSIVDITAAAGMGSVTVKNSTVFSGAYSENLTATKHCNGKDYWVIIANSGFLLFSYYQSYIAYHLAAIGLNNSAVVSSFTVPSANLAGDKGAVKISPNGKKIGLANYSTNSRSFKLADFDNSTGQVSNPFVLGGPWGYGCEFSPDGSKFYGSELGAIDIFYQWDLSLGSNAAIDASQTTLGTIYGSLQLAPDGKIYGAQLNQPYLGVINNPNLAGGLCNFVYNGQSLGSSYANICLPNFAGSFFNISPTLTFSSNSGLSMCIGETKTLNVSGATSYTWNGSTSGSSLVISPNVTSTYSVIGTTTSGCIYKEVVTVTVSNCVGINENDISELKLFPNPTMDNLQIQISSDSWKAFMRLDIYNSIGQLISTLEFSDVNKIENINVSGFENGVYTIYFTNSKKEILIRKLIISR